jgi:hypothetical protein
MTTNRIGNFAGKVALVTGAASGIGRAAALAFARDAILSNVASILTKGCAGVMSPYPVVVSVE